MLTLPGVSQGFAPARDSGMPVTQMLTNLGPELGAFLSPREESSYDAVQVIDGKPCRGEARIVTARVDYTKDFYTAASWPRGQKPLTPALEQTVHLSISTDAGSQSTMTTVALDAAKPAHALKLTTSVQSSAGIATSQFQLWRTPPKQLYHSPRDGEGTGERVLDERPEAHFEEELPLLLRGLDFRSALEGTFFLYDSQIGAATPAPTPWPARFTVRDEAGHWKVTVEVADGRMIEYDFAAAPPHALLLFRHSDGRSLTLRPEKLPDGT